MTNLDAANKAKKADFFTAYKEARAAKSEKQAINSAPVRIDEQIKNFGKTSLGKREEQALYRDALSV